MYNLEEQNCDKRDQADIDYEISRRKKNDEESEIECGCGCISFQLFYGNYELMARCTICKTIWSVYSG